jgi:hypothetical protein
VNYFARVVTRDWIVGADGNIYALRVEGENGPPLFVADSIDTEFAQHVVGLHNDWISQCITQLMGQDS